MHVQGITNNDRDNQQAGKDVLFVNMKHSLNNLVTDNSKLNQEEFLKIKNEKVEKTTRQQYRNNL